jgi:spore cortex biosynthesis protein YabQ
MIYTTDIIGFQWEIFIKSLSLGMILGGCYDFLRVIRILVRFGKRIFIASDFLYCVWAAFLIFSFLLNENFGIPRFYIFFGAALGFSLWYFTLGKINIFLAKKLRRILKAIFKPFQKIFQKILKIVKKRVIKGKIFWQKAKNKPERLLKNKAGLVYNILCLNIFKAFSFCGEKAGKEPQNFESNGTEKTEERSFPESGGGCLRGISSLFADIDAGRHQQKTKRT